MFRRILLTVLLAFAIPTVTEAGVSTPPSIPPFTPETTGTRPVVAAGLNHIYALDASNYQVYRRGRTGGPGTVVVHRTPLWSLFAAEIKKLNLNVTYPASTGITPCPVRFAGAPSIPDANGYVPFEKVACIERAYDSDVLYDPQTKRIWILAHLRPSIWKCKDQQGYWTRADPAGTCHLPSLATLKAMLHRYIAVAVSRPGATSADPEDPANGFSSFILADDYGDWTQLMVHNGLVLVNSRDLGTDNRLYVFGADDLINGTIPNGSVLPTPSAKFDKNNFNRSAVDWVNKKTVQVTLNTAMMFVRQQSDPKVTYLLSGTADAKMVVYGLLTNRAATGRMPAPTLIMPAVVSLPETMPQLQKASGAYIGGYLYWGWGSTETYTGRGYVRTFRWPLHRASTAWNGVYPVFVSNDPASGYLEADIGKEIKDYNWVLPTMNAAPNGDVITMVNAFPAHQTYSEPQGGSVWYAVLRKGEIKYDYPYYLSPARGVATDPPHKGGVLDITTVAPDPLVPGQFFLGNAYSGETGGWPHVIAGVKP